MVQDEDEMGLGASRRRRTARNMGASEVGIGSFSCRVISLTSPRGRHRSGPEADLCR